jgi:glucose-6-phosphate 1-dehydrogenase
MPRSASSRNPRWAGVPFYLRTGKRLGKRGHRDRGRLQAAPHLPFDDDR